MANAVYNLRIAILPRQVTGRTGANEAIEDWQEPGRRYSAKRLAMTAGEEIRAGMKEGMEYLRLEIVGQNIPVLYGDYVRLIVGGQMYRITSDPVRAERVTILTCETLKRK